ncbi:hypothetical protein Tsubulata_046877 [Turnera subulata]|uniref:Magnesium-dependent phosphatase-1 n=1 Tax=Turnera subulata TaxID=218843 RepID=A0A9Q0G0G5_9ROSI|nr:hypothetical protein Tsubulata_046877 [Turnera subulata]
MMRLGLPGREKMGDDRVKNEALQIIGMFQVLPRLVVFDLDYTLWPFYCECRSKREMPSLYPQAKGILNAFKDKGIDMAIASRSPTPDIANTFIDKLNIKPMFVAKVKSLWIGGSMARWNICSEGERTRCGSWHELVIENEIFSSWTHKTEHFQKIHLRTGVPFNSMLFFDDEDRNIQTVSKMGVTSILVDNGVNLGALREGLTKFTQNVKTTEKNKERWAKFTQNPNSSKSKSED